MQQTFGEYERIAKGLLATCCTPYLCNKIKRDDETFATVVYSVIQADEKWNGKGTVEGYRKQNFIYTIRDIVSDYNNRWEAKASKYHGRPVVVFSIPCLEEDKFSSGRVEILDQQQFENSIIDEDIEEILHILNDDSICTKQECNYMTKHFIYGLSLAAIGREEGVSRERVRQVVSSAITAIRKAIRKNGD